MRDERGSLDLVRIGKPLRPEFAGWRYGDRLERRRRGRALRLAGAALLTGATSALVTGALGVSGVIGAAAVGWALGSVREQASGARVLRPRTREGSALRVRHRDLSEARIVANESSGWTLQLLARDGTGPARPIAFAHDDALRPLATVLPALGMIGGTRASVAHAVVLLEAAWTPERLFGAEREARERAAMATAPWLFRRELARPGVPLSTLPLELRLALEMAAHEETERRALEGELSLLEAAWRDAEAIARIADSLALPAGVEARFESLRRPAR